LEAKNCFVGIAAQQKDNADVVKLFAPYLADTTVEGCSPPPQFGISSDSTLLRVETIAKRAITCEHVRTESTDFVLETYYLYPQQNYFYQQCPQNNTVNTLTQHLTRAIGSSQQNALHLIGMTSSYRLRFEDSSLMYL